MSKKDKIEKQIEMLKYWLSVFVISEIGLLSWLVSNFEKANSFYYIGAVAFIVLLFSIFFINRKIHKKINQLEDL
jgi:uncharacterized membrane protein